MQPVPRSDFEIAASGTYLDAECLHVLFMIGILAQTHNEKFFVHIAISQLYHYYYCVTLMVDRLLPATTVAYLPSSLIHLLW